jgi:hypothetical protein
MLRCGSLQTLSCEDCALLSCDINGSALFFDTPNLLNANFSGCIELTDLFLMTLVASSKHLERLVMHHGGKNLKRPIIIGSHLKVVDFTECRFLTKPELYVSLVLPGLFCMQNSRLPPWSHFCRPLALWPPISVLLWWSSILTDAVT